MLGELLERGFNSLNNETSFSNEMFCEPSVNAVITRKAD